MFPTPSKMHRRILAVAAVPVLGLSNQAHAAIEEVTFQEQGLFTQVGPPGGPEPVLLSGHFFFDTSQVTGGLRPVFQLPGVPPGGIGTVSVFFGAAGPIGSETLTFSDGSTVTVPFRSGFSLTGDFQAMVCGAFDDCEYALGQVLTLDQFNAAPDPWALVTNGMAGGFNFSLYENPVGGWITNGGGHFNVQSVPEPATLSLLALGLAALGLMRFCKARRSCVIAPSAR